jgi:nicotinate-nucleotide adenylyltransferase
MKIGIMGGTFDPIHNGHLRIIEKAQEQLILDEVIIVPTSQPPHKNFDSIQASPQDRYHMTSLAVKSLPYARVSNFEMKDSGAAYTIDTLQHFSEQKKADYFLIIGGDSWLHFDSWKNAVKIQELSTLVVAARDTLKAKVINERSMIELKMEKCNISSSTIRKNIAQGNDVSHQIPVSVMKYIQERSLYGWSNGCQ